MLNLNVGTKKGRAALRPAPWDYMSAIASGILAVRDVRRGSKFGGGVRALTAVFYFFHKCYHMLLLAISVLCLRAVNQASDPACSPQCEGCGHPARLSRHVNPFGLECETLGQLSASALGG